jgi:epoxyqueuosine reductase QueG
MIRISSILTDAPLETSMPVNESRCGNCAACVNACPGGAVAGNNWYAGLNRDALLDHVKCAEAAKKQAMAGFGEADTVCGKCIEVCPYSRRARIVK